MFEVWQILALIGAFLVCMGLIAWTLYSLFHQPCYCFEFPGDNPDCPKHGHLYKHLRPR